MRLVLDTDVVVAGFRSPAGASAEIVRRARRGDLTLVATTALIVEYESVCLRDEHLVAAGLGPKDAAAYLDAIASLVEEVNVWFRWRPQLRDPDDEIVLDAALNGRAASIVTFNRRHYLPVVHRFGLQACLPSEVLGRLMR